MSTVESKDSHADLLKSAYEDLRRIAATTMGRLPAGSTLQPTALVHEAWIRLGATENADWQSRSHFVNAVAEAMRHILIDRARQRSAIRHGGGHERIDLEQLEIPIDTEDDERLLAIGFAVNRLAVKHPEAATLVTLCGFVGFEIPEAARMLGIPRTTAYRRWKFATTWLYCDLRDPSERSS